MRRSSRLEQHDADVADTEVDQVLGIVCGAAEAVANDHMPGGVVLFVEFRPDERSNVWIVVVLLECLREEGRLDLIMGF